MKTLPAIIDSIKLSLANYNVVDDFKLDNEFIGDKVNDVRAILIHDEMNQKKAVDDLYYQRTCCLRIELNANKSCEPECQPTGINELYVTLPPLITRVGWANIKYFGHIDMTKNLTRKSLSGYLAGKHARWSGKNPFYTVVSQTTAIFENLDCPLEYLCMVGLFANPVDVCDYNISTDYYPVPDPHKLELIVKQDILATYMIPRDEKNDARHGEEGQQTQRRR